MFKRIITILFLIILIPLFSGCGKSDNKSLKSVTLEWWRVWDNQSDFDDIIAKYRATHPYIKVSVRKFRYEEYEKELVNALAEGRGPDMFSIPNTWVRGYKNKIEPLPEKTIVTKQVVSGPAWKQESETIKEAEVSLTAAKLKQDFAEVVYRDVMIDDKIYGLPLSLDTLTLFYNKAILDSSGIALPPTNWEEFKEAVQKTTILDSEDNIVQAGVALGTSSNIERSTDILSLLMMQNGAQMINSSQSRAIFDREPENSDDNNYEPGVDASVFYTDFANPLKEVYSWNDQMPNAIEAFAQGKLAFMFGYSYHIPVIKVKAPKLNFAVVSMLQVSPTRKINQANYWIETVSTQTENIDIAWNFLQFAVDENNVKSYLESTGKPAALRTLINEQMNDVALAPFASQVLTAQSWYHGKDFNAVEEIFKDMIRNIASGILEPSRAVSNAAKQVTRTLK